MKEKKESSRSCSLEQIKIHKLIEDNIELGEFMARALLKKWRMYMDKDQVLSAVGISLTEAANRFDEKHGASFSTFFHFYLRGTLIKELTRTIKFQSHFSPSNSEIEMAILEESIVADDSFSNSSGMNPEELLTQREVSESCKQACGRLDSLEREVIERHFVCEESISKIATILGYSRCHISRVKTTALERLSGPLKNYAPEKSLAKTGVLAKKSNLKRRRRFELDRAAL